MRAISVFRSVMESLENRRLLSTVVLGDKTDYGVGVYPVGLAAADVTGDGTIDLIAANTNNSTVSVLKGNGDGTFQAQYTLPTGVDPTSVTTADLNNDHLPDLITANAGSGSVGTVSVLIETGMGTFTDAQDYAAGGEPEQVVAADVNNDGNQDLIVANEDTNNVSVLLGEGNGTMRPQMTFAVGDDPNSVAVGDFNGDGNIDIVTANRGDNTVSLLLGNGKGSFAAPETFDVGSDPWSVTVGDFNLDGKLDIATANNLSDSVSVLLGNGKGSFAAAKNYSAGSNPISITTADLNGDTVPDLAVANDNSTTATVLLNNGDGTFAAPKAFAVGNTPYAIVAADFNGDGNADIATANYRDFTVSVLLDQPLIRAPKLITPTSKATGVSLEPTLSWTNVLSGSRYRVLITTSSGGLPTDPSPGAAASSVVDDDTAYGPSLTIDTHLRPATTYYWEVQAANGNHVGSWSKIGSFTTVPDTAPVIHKIANFEVQLGTPLESSGLFTDPDDFDRWTGLIDWGDGTGRHTLTLQSNKRFVLAHAFTKTGTFVATVTITDHYGKSSVCEFQVKVAK